MSGVLSGIEPGPPPSVSNLGKSGLDLAFTE
jgi:hypothetical protein